MFIRTERLFLRPRWPDDLDDFVALLDDGPITQVCSTTRLPHGIAAARRVIGESVDRRLPNFFIHLRADGGLKLIGGIGLALVPSAGVEVELRFWIARAHRSHGFGSEAVRALLQHAWMLGHDKILAFQFEGSGADHHVLASAGFAPTGGSRMRFSERDGCELPALVYAARRPASPGFGPITSDVPARIGGEAQAA